MPIRLVLLIAVVLFTVMPAHAQKEKGTSLPSGSLFFTMKGKPFALEKLFPGIHGALLLTDDQKRDLNAAWEKTLGSAEVREAGLALKSDKTADAAKKEAARKVIDEAQANLAKEVASVLTREQKILVEKLNAAAQEALQAAREKFETEFTDAKGNKEKAAEVEKRYMEEAVSQFNQRIANVLSPQQKEGLDKTAAEQKAASANTGNKKK